MYNVYHYNNVIAFIQSDSTVACTPNSQTGTTFEGSILRKATLFVINFPSWTRHVRNRMLLQTINHHDNKENGMGPSEPICEFFW